MIYVDETEANQGKLKNTLNFSNYQNFSRKKNFPPTFTSGGDKAPLALPVSPLTATQFLVMFKLTTYIVLILSLFQHIIYEQLEILY